MLGTSTFDWCSGSSPASSAQLPSVSNRKRPRKNVPSCPLSASDLPQDAGAILHELVELQRQGSTNPA